MDPADFNKLIQSYRGALCVRRVFIVFMVGLTPKLLRP
jgi:hypothetical protein